MSSLESLRCFVCFTLIISFYIFIIITIVIVVIIINIAIIIIILLLLCYIIIIVLCGTTRHIIGLKWVSKETWKNFAVVLFLVVIEFLNVLDDMVSDSYHLSGFSLMRSLFTNEEAFH